ncbi:SAM-dependent methyltransferase [Pseudoalteromonas sp. NBT06-2]|uniref:class I SAM-dependent methyltransferase n=1 Tax=Pseudoalteromonas sp. NBT06-2 TaxID=2025950 RepID=UPI000BA730DE|nr:class I SAM-dependent methyltransferase [Pseudoalteromonas sp. NBT06-2]PAJ72968.1 SAM-dependent methyltransferase [Pseudoalteromonas sp. NBT06-2]
MEPLKQADNYDKIANHWVSENFNRDNGIEQHKRALQLVKKKEKAIDVGCGSSGRIIDVLLNDGFIVEALDLSIEMLNIARQSHPDVQFYHADICKWDFPKKYDFISAWDSVWHAPLEEQENILKKLCNALTPKGVLIYTSGAVDEPGDGSNEFLGQILDYAAIGIPKPLQDAGFSWN